MTRDTGILSDLRAGYAVQSPKGATLFEENELDLAMECVEKTERGWLQRVMLSNQGGRRVQLPIPCGWRIHQ